VTRYEGVGLVGVAPSDENAGVAPSEARHPPQRLDRVKACGLDVLLVLTAGVRAEGRFRDLPLLVLPDVQAKDDRARVGELVDGLKGDIGWPPDLTIRVDDGRLPYATGKASEVTFEHQVSVTLGRYGYEDAVIDSSETIVRAGCGMCGWRRRLQSARYGQGGSGVSGARIATLLAEATSRPCSLSPMTTSSRASCVTNEIRLHQKPGDGGSQGV